MMAPVLRTSPSVEDTYSRYNVISNQVKKSCISGQFCDLIIQTPEGQVPCHQALLVPLSPFLGSLLASIPTCPGLVPHVVIPLSLDIVKKILHITYTGQVYVKSRTEMEQLLSGLDFLGVKLPGLQCIEVPALVTETEPVLPSASGVRVVSASRLKKKEGTNNNLVNLPLFPHPNEGLDNSTVRLPSKVLKHVPTARNLPQPTVSLLQLKTQLAQQLFPLGIDESMQCNVDGCKSLVTLKGLMDHFKSHDLPSVSIKCGACNLGFKDKKALEIRRTIEHPVVGTTTKLPRMINKENVVNLAYTEETETTRRDTLVCQVCIASLKSEWHKRRHKCQNGSPSIKKTPKVSPSVKAKRQASLSKSVPNNDQYLCNSSLPSKWYKPPSRHSCVAGLDTNKNPEASESRDQSSSTSGSRKRSRSMSRPDTSRKQQLLSCQICAQTFSSLIHQKTHYTKAHYWDKITSQFSAWDRSCYICLKSFPTSIHLREHMGNFHSYVDQCLVADKLLPISVGTTIVLLSLKCDLCGDETSTSSELKSHLSNVHFNKELEREFPGGVTGQKNRKCDICGKMFKDESNRIKHIGSFHDQVLKYAKETITVYDVDKEYIAENNFEPGQIVITETLEDVDMTMLNKWKPFGQFKRFSNQIDNPGTIESYPCPLTTCTRQCGNKSQLLVHLTMTHYLEECEAKFGADCLPDECSKCDLKLPKSKLGFIKHMAVEHEMVITFVERDSASVPHVSN